jgi:hypothetical protein
MSKLEHITRFTAGHDCIKFKCRWDKVDCVPNGGGSHGVHGVNLLFLVKGDKGAVQFLIYTGWLPQSAKSGVCGRFIDEWGGNALPANLGFHSPVPTYDGQSVSTDACKCLDGEPCYYDGSGLKANDAMYALVNGGDVALWEFLEGYYACVFEDGVYPVPAEYCKERRAK